MYHTCHIEPQLRHATACPCCAGSGDSPALPGRDCPRCRGSGLSYPDADPPGPPGPAGPATAAGARVLDSIARRLRAG